MNFFMCAVDNMIYTLLIYRTFVLHFAGIFILKSPEICYVIAVLNIKINAHHDNMWLILNDLIPLSSNLSYLSPPRFLFETLLYLTLVVSLSGFF